MLKSLIVVFLVCLVMATLTSAGYMYPGYNGYASGGWGTGWGSGFNRFNGFNGFNGFNNGFNNGYRRITY